MAQGLIERASLAVEAAAEALRAARRAQRKAVRATFDPGPPLALGEPLEGVERDGVLRAGAWLRRREARLA